MLWSSRFCIIKTTLRFCEVTTLIAFLFVSTLVDLGSKKWKLVFTAEKALKLEWNAVFYYFINL